MLTANAPRADVPARKPRNRLPELAAIVLLLALAGCTAAPVHRAAVTAPAGRASAAAAGPATA